MHKPMKTVFCGPLMAFLFAAAASAQTTPEEFKAIAWDKSHVGTPLDLSRYKQTFVDNFDAMSVTADNGVGPWFAPGHSTFGAAKFVPPGPSGPFSVANGQLTIRAEKHIVETPQGRKTKWTTGCMQTVDTKGHGFAQRYGYFEMRASLPDGRGGWPAFWLLSQNGYLDKSKRRTEIDILEWYGGDPKGVHACVHIWPAGQRAADDPLQKNIHRSLYHNLNKVTPPGLTDGQLKGPHIYGGELTPEWVIMYFDRREIGRFKMLPEWKTPLYMLVDLAIFPKEAKDAASPKEMVVDYVAAYARQAGAE
jgi:beta-glucanase (GH16 family)